MCDSRRLGPVVLVLLLNVLLLLMLSWVLRNRASVHRSRASVSRVGAPGVRNITIIVVIGVGGRVVVIASVPMCVLSEPGSRTRPVLVAMSGFGWTPVLVWLVGHNSTNAPKIPSVQESPRFALTKV